MSSVNQYGACPDTPGGCCDISEFLGNFSLGLIYESALASVPKCGEYPGLPTSDKFWRHRTRNIDAVGDGKTYHTELHAQWDDSSGSCLYHMTITGSSTGPDFNVALFNESFSPSSSPPDIWTGTVNGEPFEGPWSNPVPGEFATQVTTYSDEYTDAEIIAKGQALLDSQAFAELGFDSARSQLNMSDGQPTGPPPGIGVEMRKIRYKIQHRPTITCYLKVWLARIFHEQNTPVALDVVTPLDSSYEWLPTNDPCLPDFTKHYGHVDNLITQSDWTIELPPDLVGGENKIVVYKFSFLQGYEPDDPELIAGALTRPDPDPESNGFPTP